MIFKFSQKSGIRNIPHLILGMRFDTCKGGIFFVCSEKSNISKYSQTFVVLFSTNEHEETKLNDN